ncbi:WYL domain-containing protein [Streptomyces sp. 8L]|uniref:WYL domain-containing protein n=1 Tax=Streptomyces sp. 8L TaxID=2877242 RepID=UPI001CD38532|nr:WYL domain-containing protein [Streptomyces sp. 8L]MCA1224313.1 WYL domain-containing protein [Streptomyces sp. 8L]
MRRTRTLTTAAHAGQALAHATLGALSHLRYRLTTRARLTITYRAADGETTTRIIEPLEVRRSKAGDWYVKAHDHLRDAARSFRLDRITTTA